LSAARHRLTPTPQSPPTATPKPTVKPTATATPRPTATPSGQSFSDSFDSSGTIEEAGAMTESSSPSWWVNSGGRFTESGGYGHTIQGDLPADDHWRTAYAQANPVDTDDGYHPQNIFRFVLRSRWRDFDQQVYFRINRVNLSASPNRNASNGVLLFNRYQLDGQTLYYAGVRVDGAAVIKKKVTGTYTTLAYRGIFPGYGTYNVANNPNLIPQDQWIGLRTVVVTNVDGSVNVQLLLDRGSGWEVVLDAIDTGASGGAPISVDGYGGIRSDFMDVDFDSYSIAQR
jgi:hypothetical protein